MARQQGDIFFYYNLILEALATTHLLELLSRRDKKRRREWENQDNANAKCHGMQI